MRVSDIMSSPVITVHDDATLEDAARLIVDNRIGGLPVVDEHGDLVGILTESDYTLKKAHIPFSFVSAPQLFRDWLEPEGIEKSYERARTHRVRDIMTTNVIKIEVDTELDKVAKLMLDHDINRLPVVRDRKPVGMVSRFDMLKLMLDARTQARAQ